LKQIGLASVNCFDSHSGSMPAGLGLWPSRKPIPNNGHGGVLFHILPYIEQDNLYKASLVSSDDRNGNFPTYSLWGLPPDNKNVKSYICPSDYTWDPSDQGLCSYAYNGQVFFLQYDGGWGQGAKTYPRLFMDGTSNTILFTEKMARAYGSDGWSPDSESGRGNLYEEWGPVIADGADGGQPTGPAAMFQVQPRPNQDGPGMSGAGNRASSPHSGGILCVLGDGSVHFVSANVNPNNWWAALTPQGGETTLPDW
jgi:hypothetical protein